MMIPDGYETTRLLQLGSGKAPNGGTTGRSKPAHCSHVLECKDRTTNSGANQVRIVELLVGELFDLACQGSLPRETAVRRPECHIRQISMYLCRVVLSMPYQHIARGLNRDRTTVIHGCAVIEDRRDNPAYDAFVDRCERCVRAIFQPARPGAL